MPLPDRDIRLRIAVPRVGNWHLAGLLSEATGLAPAVAAALVRHGSCRLDGKVIRIPELPLLPGALLVVTYIPTPAAPRPVVRHLDDHLIVVEKPAGVPSQPTREGAENSLVEQVARMTGSSDLHVVHRLDIGVSGLLALARGRKAAADLTRAFAAGSVKKLYLAAPEVTDSGLAWLLASRHKEPLVAPLRWVSRRRQALVANDGQPCRTDVLHAALTQEQWLLLLRLHTGRTHQIRAHLAHVGLPLMGDSKYGAPTHSRRIGLHCIHLSLPHPSLGTIHRFWADPPPDFLDLTGIDWNKESADFWRGKAG